MLTLEEQQAGEYFWTLRHYRPMLNRRGVPALLSNSGWDKPFCCFVVVNVMCMSLMVVLYRTEWTSGKIFLHTTMMAILLFDSSYLLAQFVNPGIVHHKMVQASSSGDIQQIALTTCSKCQTVCESGRATHCDQCEVCILDLDHHCGWFGRCIGAYNKWFFYLFLLSTFGLFVNMIVTATYALDQ